MITLKYDFIYPGARIEPRQGRVYLDVGDQLCAGIIDHHQDRGDLVCTALLVLRHPELVTRQVVATGGKKQLTVVLHHLPDLDAVTSAWFVRLLVTQPDAITPAARAWAEYVCKVDRGETRLDPQHPITPYSLFMARMHLVRRDRPENLDMAMLEAGCDFVAAMLEKMEQGYDPEKAGQPLNDPSLAREKRFVEEDFQRYRDDLAKSEIISVPLPRKDGQGCLRVPGLWVENPGSALFKSWARGDRQHAPAGPGFVFTGVRLGPARFILSVDPDSPVFLRGLGELLEEHETVRRRELGRVRTGENRPGYNSPDPWYDGRSPLHNYTIIDTPRDGTVLGPAEIRDIFHRYVARMCPDDNRNNRNKSG